MLWRKSSRSVGQGACVEMAVQADTRLVRDSKNPSGPMLTFPAGAMRIFLGTIRNTTGRDETN